jgi:ribosomal protein L3
VWKGKKMPGRMGGKNKTTQNLKVMKVSVVYTDALRTVVVLVLVVFILNLHVHALSL